MLRIDYKCHVSLLRLKHQVMKLQMAWPRKIIVLGLFLMGALYASRVGLLSLRSIDNDQGDCSEYLKDDILHSRAEW